MQKHLCIRDVDFTFAAPETDEERSGDGAAAIGAPRPVETQ